MYARRFHGLKNYLLNCVPQKTDGVYKRNSKKGQRETALLRRHFGIVINLFESLKSVALHTSFSKTLTLFGYNNYNSIQGGTERFVTTEYAKVERRRWGREGEDALIKAGQRNKKLIKKT